MEHGPFPIFNAGLEIWEKSKAMLFFYLHKKRNGTKNVAKKKEEKEQKNISTRQLLNKGNFKKQNCPSSSYP